MKVVRDTRAAHGGAAEGDDAVWNVDGKSARAPSMRLLLSEPARSLADLASRLYHIGDSLRAKFLGNLCRS